MREHKYRAWHSGAKRMYLVTSLDMSNEGVSDIAVKVHEAEGIIYSSTCPADQLELMQYTGLKDRQGKEIYEGDILLVRFGKHTVEVRWKVTGFGFFNLGTQQWQLLYVTDLKQIEVIGNIYEHPELTQGMSA